MNNLTQKVRENEESGSIGILNYNDESNDHNLGSELILSDSVFKPIYNLGVWLAPDDYQNAHVSVAILLFTSTDKNVR